MTTDPYAAYRLPPEECGPIVNRLLAIGGERVVTLKDPHLPIILSRGQSFDAKRVKIKRGSPSRCHTNAALYYLAHFNGQTGYQRCEIARGYGLSRDGLWRQHTWLLADGQVIETTVRRIHYFGTILTAGEAVEFVLGEVSSRLLGYREWTDQLPQRNAG